MARPNKHAARFGPKHGYGARNRIIVGPIRLRRGAALYNCWILAPGETITDIDRAWFRGELPGRQWPYRDFD